MISETGTEIGSQLQNAWDAERPCWILPDFKGQHQHFSGYYRGKSQRHPDTKVDEETTEKKARGAGEVAQHLGV